jgi:hypothetical protein
MSKEDDVKLPLLLLQDYMSGHQNSFHGEEDFLWIHFFYGVITKKKDRLC